MYLPKIKITNFNVYYVKKNYINKMFLESALLL